MSMVSTPSSEEAHPLGYPKCSEPVVFASLVAAVLAFAESLGVSRECLLRSSRVSCEATDDPDALVPYTLLLDLWSTLVDRFPDRPLGLQHANSFRLTNIGVLGYAITRARHFGHAFGLCTRFCGLLDPFVEVRVDRFDAIVRVSICHERSVERLAEPIEAICASLFRTMCDLNQQMTPPLEVCFRHSRRHGEEHYPRFFSGVRPTFEAGYSGLVFDAAILDLPIRTAEPQLVVHLEHYAKLLLERLTPCSRDAAFDAQVREVLEVWPQDLEVEPARVARLLGTSVRSMQRRLRALDTSLTQQLDAVRRSRALALISRKELSIAEIAFTLGYTDPRAFYRSFRRWTGRTPSAYRDALRAG